MGRRKEEPRQWLENLESNRLSKDQPPPRIRSSILPKGSPPKRVKRKILIARMKAYHIARVLKEKGHIDLKEARRRMYPREKESTVNAHYHKMLDELVYNELQKILQLSDKDIYQKVKPEVILQDILRDLAILNELIKRKELDVETVAKLLHAKTPKQKLLGSAIALWKSESPEDREKTASELLLELHKLARAERKYLSTDVNQNNPREEPSPDDNHHQEDSSEKH